jgi:prepilin-type N-terminal cleavage/methylation domain-containing protein
VIFMGSYCRCKGFTLVEVLVLLSIMSIVVALVFPASYKTVEKFENYLQSHSSNQQNRQMHFDQFISDGLLKSEQRVLKE